MKCFVITGVLVNLGAELFSLVFFKLQKHNACSHGSVHDLKKNVYVYSQSNFGNLIFFFVFDVCIRDFM